MTVHAAKGLEFPIVFVVNMGRGTGGAARADPRHRRSSDGEPAVAIADFQSEADEDAQAREREETKRLLYVALTRARDRLYLSATVEDGVCRTGRGSLGEVLPRSLLDLLGAASGGTEVSRPMTWAPAGGREHRFVAQRYDPSAEPRVLPPRDVGHPVSRRFRAGLTRIDLGEGGTDVFSWPTNQESLLAWP